MLAPDGACDPPFLRARRGGRPPHRRPPRRRRPRLALRLARRLDRNRGPDRRGGRDPARDLHRLPPVPRGAVMRAGIFATPRPEPGHILPAVAGALVIVLALPIFLVAGWPLAGWALAAVMWVGVH